jgi:hypothetical protein
MNEEKKEAPLEDPRVHQNHQPPLEDPRVCRNRLARERHAVQSEKQCATNASQWVAQLFKTKCFFEINTV